MNDREYNELELLAKDFIIGYQPLNVEEKRLLSICKVLQVRLNGIRREEKRILKLLKVMDELMLNAHNNYNNPNEAFDKGKK